MKKYQNKREQITNYLILFLVAVLPRVIICLNSQMGFWPSDEVATVSGAAKLAGFDWSAVVSRAGYYGQGFYSLFAPVFYLTDDPFIIYRSMAVVCALLQGSVAYLAYYCLRRFFYVKHRWLLLIMAIGCSYMLNTEANILYNEHPFLLIAWLATILLLQLNENVDNKKKKAVFTILLIIVLGYSLTIHTRAWVLWIALAVVVIAYYFAYRKWLISLPVCFTLGICLIGLVLVYIGYVQRDIWLTDDSGSLRNAGINIKIDGVSLTKVFAWCCIMIGQLNSAIYATIGVAVIGVVLLLALIFRVFRKKKALPANSYDFEKKYFVLGVFFLMAIVASIGGLSLNWLDGLTEAIENDYGTDAVAYKILFYFRYIAIYTGPLLMVTFSYFYHFKKTLKRFYKPATMVLVFLQACWFIFIVPYVHNYQGYKSSRLSPYVFFIFGQKVNIITFIAAAFFVFLVWFLMWKYLKKGRILVPIGLVTAFLVYHYISMSVCYVMPQQERRYEKINGGYKLVGRLEEKNIELQSIYAPAVVENTQCSYYYYQYYLNRYTIYPYCPDATVENPIVFYAKSDYEILKVAGYSCYRLDKNEYVYVISPDMIMAIEDLGYKKVK